MKKFISILLLFVFSTSYSYAVDFDTSIDEIIRDKYNVQKNEALPKPPSTIPTASDVTPAKPIIVEPVKHNPTGKVYRLKSGTKVNLISKNSVSDWSPKGTVISFVAQNGFCAKDGTIIPAGTVFKGRIMDSHPPQITGNGGLIEISVDEIYFNGVKSFVETKLMSVNSRKVFLSDVKGNRCYWRNFAKDMRAGKKVFIATKDFAKDIAGIPVINLFSAVSIVGGSVFYVGNLIVAPFVSVFQKGENMLIPAGSEFQIKITDNSEIRG